MAEIIHRYVNGVEVSFGELGSYQITNRTILDIVTNAVQRIHSDPEDKSMIVTINSNVR